jgi:hypothetical protein
MMKTVSATLLALALLSGAAQAQTLSTMLPTLTWPDDQVTTSTKGCVTNTATVCTPKE